jgi:hypothetical protein
MITHRTALTKTLALLLLASPAAAQQAPPKPPELEILRQHAGGWTSDGTVKVAAWNSVERKFEATNHGEFVLNGWYLRDIEINRDAEDPNRLSKSLFYSNYDPVSKKYVTWAFQSSGNIGKVTGTYDPTAKKFSYTYADPAPSSTGRVTTTFPSPDEMDGAIDFTDESGQTLFAIDWMKKRLGDLDVEAFSRDWAKIGTPIEPLPDEIKKLEPFIGEWDVEFIAQPSTYSPQARTSEGTISSEWILDGRFLLGRSEVNSQKSNWVIGYDPNKKAYRYVRFPSDAQPEESVGQWNDATRSFEWKVVNGKPNVTKTSTNRFVGKDAIQTHVLAEDKEGNVQMDLTIRSTRRK